ncbi:hypothetical protein SAMN06265375_101706 [Muriicola jejuensis]|nr:hypothetical protein SAMN06265375_101706 [Muriicola jejuensis]
MKKCILLFLLFVFVLAIASIIENREREAVNSDKSQPEFALQQKTSESNTTP